MSVLFVNNYNCLHHSSKTQSEREKTCYSTIWGWLKKLGKIIEFILPKQRKQQRCLRDCANAHADLRSCCSDMLTAVFLITKHFYPRSSLGNAGILCLLLVEFERIRDREEVNLLETVKHMKQRNSMLLSDYVRLSYIV